MPEPRSEELMAAVARGDERAFEKLVARYQLPLINYFFPLAWDRHIAEDLAQEVFVRLYTSCGAYAPTGRFTSYLYRIARNCWIDWRRQSKRRRLERSLDADEEGSVSLRETLAVMAEQPEDTARKEEFVKGLIQAVGGLPAEHKEVFILSQVEGLRYRDIAEILDIPEGTVKSRMNAAMRKIRESVGAAGRRQ